MWPNQLYCSFFMLPGAIHTGDTAGNICNLLFLKLVQGTKKGATVREDGKQMAKINNKHSFFFSENGKFSCSFLYLKVLPSKELNVPGIYSENLEQSVFVTHTLLLKTKILFITTSFA